MRDRKKKLRKLRKLKRLKRRIKSIVLRIRKRKTKGRNQKMKYQLLSSIGIRTSII